MKRIANYLIALAVAAFTFTSCEDVPSPFGTVVQPDSGEEVVIEPQGSGTKSDPYNVAAALEFVSGLGADVPSDKEIYVKGFVTGIKEQFSAQYGNAQFTMSDTKEGANTFTFFRGLYLGNKKWQEGDLLLAEGDEVIVCGKVVNYKGNTPETVQNAAYTYSINGKTEGGGGGGDGEAKGTGTANDPFNIAAAIAKCKEIGETASTEKYYVKGIVVDGGTVSGGFGNVTFKLGDSADATELFTAYQVAGSDGEKLADGYEVKKGSTVIVYGPIMNYKGNTPETAGKSAAQIVTIDGKKTNEGGGGATGGDGSQNNPFNIAEAIAKCKEVGESASTEKYYIKGIVVTGGTASGGYGNVTFKLGDSADATELFTAYQVAGSDGEKLADGYEVKKGSTVVIYGPIMNYKGNTPETAGKSAAQIVTIDGKKTNAGGGGGGGSETGGDDITAAFADLDCSNLAAIKLSDGTTIAVTQEDGKSVPIYHESTKIIRIYARNAMTIDAGSKKIAKLVLSYDTYQGTAYKGNDELYGEVGTSKITPSKDDATVTFSNVNGNKIKVVNWLESGNSGGVQLRLTKITITYAK